MAKKIDVEWEMFDGLFARQGKRRLIYPDPLADDCVEAFCGQFNFMRQGGVDEEEIKQMVKSYGDIFGLHFGPKPEPVTRAEFNEQDVLRAKGLGIRLD